MQDASILGHIRRLADERLRLRLQYGADAEEKKTLTQIEVELHQCWDLLRQRRARREFRAGTRASRATEVGSFHL